MSRPFAALTALFLVLLPAGGRAAEPVAAATRTTKPAPAAKLLPAGSDTIATLRSQVAKDTSKFEPIYRLGVAFADAGIYRDAIRSWKKVLQLAPASPEATSAKESIDILSKFVKD